VLSEKWLLGKKDKRGQEMEKGREKVNEK